MKIAIALLISTVTSAWAQDVIVKKDDSKIDAKIIEIQGSEIRYKKFSNPDGPDYTISKREVAEVRYQNGEVESLAKVKQATGSEDFGRHFVSYNAFALLFSNVNFAYEHFFPSGYFSVKVPLTIGFSSDELDDDPSSDIVKIGKNKIFNVGVDFNFYPTGQGRAKYFMGTGIEYGQYKYQKNVYYYDPLATQRDYNNSAANYMAITFKNGILFQPTDNFNIQLTGGLGMGRDYASYNYFYSVNNGNRYTYTEDHYFFYASGALNIGVRF